MTDAAQTAAKTEAPVPAPQNFVGVTPPAAPAPQSAAAPEKLPVIDAHASEILTPLDTILSQYWGGLQERDALFQYVNPNNVKASKKGVSFMLDNGIELLWSTSTLRNPDGSPLEFIGAPGKMFGKTAFDQDAANAVIMLAISKGWQGVTLHGPDEHKEMMWLAAQKAGMPVTNFTPAADAKVWKKLEQDSPEAYQHTMQRMLGVPQQQQPQPQQEALSPEKKQPGIQSRFAFAEDPFEQALQQRIDQTQNPQEAAGLKQILDDVRGGKLELDAREKANFLQKIDSPILLADRHGRTVTPVESALALVDQKRASEKPAETTATAKPGERIEPTFNPAVPALLQPKPPEPK